MNGTISLPNLPPEQVAEIQQLYAEGKTLKAISNQTGLRYPIVYFYTANRGEKYFKKHGPCWCGKPHYAKGKCHYHWLQERIAIRKGELSQ